MPSSAADASPAGRRGALAPVDPPLSAIPVRQEHFSCLSPTSRRPRGAAAIAQQGRAHPLAAGPGGAYPGEPDFSAYRGFSWFRDGAFIADAMSAPGELESADRVLRLVRPHAVASGGPHRPIVAGAASGARLADQQMLPTRFTLEAAKATAIDWWDFQLDGYGLWLWAARRARRTPWTRCRPLGRASS